MQESWEEKGNKSILLILRGFDSPTDYDGQTDTSRDIHTFQRIKIQEYCVEWRARRRGTYHTPNSEPEEEIIEGEDSMQAD